MSLPGKLSIGILEEDNPLRSYFRFKPLLVDDAGRYVPYEDAARYPDEGCVRIVPDKNESYHFKARMRQIGLFCVVDLRAHPGESDKIRPNKNYRPGGEEINANIIYSDVVRAPAANTIVEVLPAEAGEKPVCEPHSPRVLLRDDSGLNPLLYAWEPIPDADGIGRLVPTESVCPLEDVQVFELPGFRNGPVAFAIRPAGTLEHVSDMPERPARVEPSHEKPAVETAHVDSHALEPSPAQTPSGAQPEAQPAVANNGPGASPARSNTAAGHGVSAGRDKSSHAAPHAAGTSAAPSEKPWIHRDASMLPPPVDRHLSRAEQLMAAQAGLNPRRGRSLQELIDERWQRSRLNQLGQPVAPIVTGAPVQNPVDAAVGAVSEAWNNPTLQKPLLDALGEIEGFTRQVNARRELNRQSAIEEQLNALEAQRLELMGELDHLKAGGAEIRQKLKQEIRRDEAAALADAVGKTQAAQAEQARYEQLAADARAAAQDAQGVLDALAGDQLDRKIRDVALTRRVLERLDRLKDAGEIDVPPAAEAIDLEQFIARVLRRFEAEGWTLTRSEAANLCVSLAVSPVLMLSGAPGSGKTTAARLLADALGLGSRAVVCEPAAGSRPRDSRIAGLRRFEAAPAAVILDDANLSSEPDPLRGLPQLAGSEWRVIATLQDLHSGLPLHAAALNKGFMVRLAPPAGLPWQPSARHACAAEGLASIAALRESLPQADLPTTMIARMDSLRRAMDACGVPVSRRALDDAWRYCSAMLACLGEDAGPDAILDLAVAQRLLPTLLAAAPVRGLVKLREFASDMPACRALMAQPAPIRIL